MRRTLMMAAAVLGLVTAGVLFTGTSLPFSVSSALAQAATTQQQATFTIENMTCALCPVTVKKAMEGVAGVKSVAIDFDAKTATVIFDPTKATVATIAQASTNAGYPARATKS